MSVSDFHPQWWTRRNLFISHIHPFCSLVSEKIICSWLMHDWDCISRMKQIVFKFSLFASTHLSRVYHYSRFLMNKEIFIYLYHNCTSLNFNFITFNYPKWQTTHINVYDIFVMYSNNISAEKTIFPLV